MLFFSIPIMMLSIMTFYISNYSTLQNQEMINFMSMNNYLMNSLVKLYNQPTGIIMILLASYLFLTLIAVVKITNIFKSALWKMN